MKLYRLNASATISLHTYVRAASLEEALVKADDFANQTIHQDERDPEDLADHMEWATSGEIDGTATDITVVDVDGDENDPELVEGTPIEGSRSPGCRR